MLIDPAGQALLAAGDHARAVRHFSSLAALDPNAPAASLGLALALAATGRFSEAEVAIAHARNLAPTSIDLLAAQANLYEQMGDQAKALQGYLDLLTRDPNHLPAAHNLGSLLYRLGYFAEAAQQHRETVRRHPQSFATWRDLGQALVAGGQLDAGIDALAKACQLAPNERDNRFAHGLALLCAGRWAEGWPLYEARWQPGEAPPGLPGVPTWQGEALTGKHLVVFAEQGYGDTLMFCRYLPLLAGLTAALSVVVPAPLVKLLRASFPDLAIDSRPTAGAAAHYSITLGSLPLRFLALGQATPPRPGRYLQPSPTARAAAAALLPEDATGLGLTWRGQPRYASNRGRSLDLPALLARSPQPEGRHYAFQPDISAAEQALLAQRGDTDLAPHLPDFDHSAALLERLGGLLTVDTAMAHLAGGLALPCHIAHRREGEWRWGTDGRGSAWYEKCWLLENCDR